MNKHANEPHERDDFEGMIEITSPEQIPHFDSAEEEGRFWDTHSLASHFFTRGQSFPGTALQRLRDRIRKAQKQGQDR